MEPVYVFHNGRSMRELLLSIILPLIPLYGILILTLLEGLEWALMPASILYLTLWIVFFVFKLCNVYNVMVVSRSQILFLSPYCEKVLPVGTVRTVYYNDNRGFSFRVMDNKERKFPFKLNGDKGEHEITFRELSQFMNFSEEHIPQSNIYCLVNNRIG